MVLCFQIYLRQPCIRSCSRVFSWPIFIVEIIRIVWVAAAHMGLCASTDSNTTESKGIQHVQRVEAVRERWKTHRWHADLLVTIRIAVGFLTFLSCQSISSFCSKRRAKNSRTSETCSADTVMIIPPKSRRTLRWPLSSLCWLTFVALAHIADLVCRTIRSSGCHP